VVFAMQHFGILNEVSLIWLVRHVVIEECGKSRISTIEVASDDKYFTRTVKTVSWCSSLRGETGKALGFRQALLLH
jgi:hypothetical protein